MSEFINHSFTVNIDQQGKRLDQALSTLLPEYSRARIQQWVQAGEVRVNAAVAKNKDKIAAGDVITVNAAVPVVVQDAPQVLDLNIVFEDKDLLVINKPAGLVVHPGAGNLDGTLLNALLHHAPQVEHLPRAGLVQRLDKYTSGIMVVAKSLPAYTALVAALQARTVKREYEAVTVGQMTGGRTIETQMGRHPKQRIKMAVVPEGYGKEAITHVRLLQRFGHHTHIRVQLETGRTHQIRVHLAHCRYPLVGDPLYGGRLILPRHAFPELADALRGFKRQALHAKALTLQHPISGEMLTWEVNLPEDMQHLLDQLVNLYPDKEG